MASHARAPERWRQRRHRQEAELEKGCDPRGGDEKRGREAMDIKQTNPTKSQARPRPMGRQMAQRPQPMFGRGGGCTK